MSGYASEKLSQAVHSLATGTGDIRNRLFSAAMNMIALKADDFPDEELRDEYAQYFRKITAVNPKGDEGSIKATLNSMGDREVVDIIEMILSMHDTMIRIK